MGVLQAHPPPRASTGKLNRGVVGTTAPMSIVCNGHQWVPWNMTLLLIYCFSWRQGGGRAVAEASMLPSLPWRLLLNRPRIQCGAYTTFQVQLLQLHTWGLEARLLGGSTEPPRMRWKLGFSQEYFLAL